MNKYSFLMIFLFSLVTLTHECTASYNTESLSKPEVNAVVSGPKKRRIIAVKTRQKPVVIQKRNEVQDCFVLGKKQMHVQSITPSHISRSKTSATVPLDIPKHRLLNDCTYIAAPHNEASSLITQIVKRRGRPLGSKNKKTK